METEWETRLLSQKLAVVLCSYTHSIGDYTIRHVQESKKGLEEVETSSGEIGRAASIADADAKAGTDCK
jgi:ApbE superfamily uncharacterized protein (UPF0280 family)